MIGHLPNVLQHLEWPGIARSQLPFGSGPQRVCRMVKETEPHPVTPCELQLQVVVVVVALVELLCLKKTLANFHEEGVTVT